ncbi:MAG: GNAT family N-acetyltransferase [Gemmatimonadota bacterium]
MIAPIHSARLTLRGLTPNDAAFIHRLVNDPDWLRYIGDRGIDTLEDAEAYIRSGPMAMYEAHGFGLLAVEPRAGGGPVGICGLLQRDWLDDADLGFAFLPEARGRGYATESAAAVIAHARSKLGLSRIVAIVTEHNALSRRLLEKIGFELEGTVQPPEAEGGVRPPEDVTEVLLYVLRPTPVP